MAPPPERTPAASVATDPPRRGRGAIWFLLVILVVGGTIAAYTVFGAGLVGGSRAAGPELAIDRVETFDPEGDGKQEENDQLVPNLTDGSESTTWRTERYGAATFPSQGGNKSGVGFYLVLGDTADVERVDLVTPTGGWDAQVYVLASLGADGSVPVDLAGWGDPVGDVTDAPTGTVEVSVSPTSGQAVLVWFTEAAPFGDQGKYAVEIGDVTVRGR